MNKKPIIIALLLAVAGMVVWLGIQTKHRLAHKKQVEANLQTLPQEATLLALDSTELSLKALVGHNKPTVIFFFEPDCEHCQAEAGELKKYARAFAHVQLLWVSMAEPYRLRQFEQQYGLEKSLTNLRISHISPHEANQRFAFRTVPTILIYNQNRQLTKKYVGETKVEAILKYLGP